MIENTILSALIYNEDYTRKVIPFLKEEYFHDLAEKKLFNTVTDYVEKYNGLPTKEALHLSLSEDSKLNESTYEQVTKLIDSLEYDEKTDVNWLTEKTEKFCQDRAIYNAVRKSITILDGDEKQLDKGSIPELLSDALGVSFDTNIGHDFLEGFAERFEFYHTKEHKVPFDLELFNKITKGGISRKSLSICLAGCVHPDTKVNIRYRKRD